MRTKVRNIISQKRIRMLSEFVFFVCVYIVLAAVIILSINFRPFVFKVCRLEADLMSY